MPSALQIRQTYWSGQRTTRGAYNYCLLQLLCISAARRLLKQSFLYIYLSWLNVNLCVSSAMLGKTISPSNFLSVTAADRRY